MMRSSQDFRIFQSFGVKHIWVVDHPARRKVYEIERGLDVAVRREVKGGLLSISELGLSIDFNDMSRELDQDLSAFCREDLLILWLGGRDSNPDTQIQSLQSYR